VDLTQPSELNLDIENLFTPPPIEENSIGFETLLGYTNPVGAALPDIDTSMGCMKVNLRNVFFLGRVVPNGDDVNIQYSFGFGPGLVRDRYCLLARDKTDSTRREFVSKP
jgi:hypothetical protein